MASAEHNLDVDALLAQTDWARSLARRLVGDAELAEDVLQDAWVAALQRPPEGARMREWFAAVVRNLALRRRRREAARGDVERRAARPEPVTGGEEALERLQLQDRLTGLVLGLDEPLRTAVVLRHVEGLSARQIAACQGCTAEAARQRVARGLARLRAKLDEQEGGDRRAWCCAFAALWGAPRDGLLTSMACSIAGLIGGTWVGTKTGLAVVVVALALGGMAWWAQGGSGAAAPTGPGLVHGIQPRTGNDPRPAGTPADLGQQIAAEPRAALEAPVVFARDAAEVGGRVLDDRGLPLAGVEVLLLEEGKDGIRATATSGPEGEFAFPIRALGEPPARDLCLRAGLESHVPVEVRRRGPDLGDLVLVRRPRVFGVLLTPEGLAAAAPGRVELAVRDSAGEEHGVRVEIDLRGRYQATELPPGVLTRARGMARGFLQVERFPGIELEPGAPYELSLTLEAGDIVHGIVVDSETGRPVPFAEVWSEAWSFESASIEPTAVADGEGRFELLGMRSHQIVNESGISGLEWVSVSARAEGYVSPVFQTHLLQRGEDGLLQHLVVRVVRAEASLVGSIVWPNGSPAPGVAIYAVGAGMSMKLSASDGEGRFALEGLAPGPLAVCAYTLPGQPEGPSGRAEHRIDLAPGARERCTLVLVPPTESLAGRVVDGNGAGLAGIQVEAGEHFEADGLIMGLGSHRRTTGSDGRFEFQGLSAGRYQVEVSKDEHRELASRPLHQVVYLVEGEPHRELEFALLPAVVFAGWVDVGEADPTAYEVERRSVAQGVYQERQSLGSSGRFHFGGCWPEPSVIALRRDGKELVSVQVGPEGATGLVITAPR